LRISAQSTANFDLHYSSQIIENLDKYENIIYIGDKYKENENDYEIMNHSKVKGIKVNNVNDTKIILQNIQNLI